MSLRSRSLFILGGGLTIVASLALGACTVRGQASAPTGTVHVQPASYSASTSVQAGYQQPGPVYQQSTVAVAQPGYSAPAPVTGVAVGVGIGGQVPLVGPGWSAEGYAPSDFVSYNMTLRARQFAAGYLPISSLYRGTMYQGQRQVVTVTATAGRCYRIIGVGGPGVRDLDLRLRDMNGTVIDQDVATDNFPVLGLQRPLCLNWTGSFQVEVIMYAGGGEYGLQAFASN